MQPFPLTYVVRHKRENKKKCSLRGLEKRSDMRFFRYPASEGFPPLDNCVLLVLDGAEELSAADKDKGLLILDSGWRYLDKMRAFIEKNQRVEKRTLPSCWQTAYPRRQEDCSDPSRGLSSLEAIFIAYRILGRDLGGLLDNYHWKEDFFKLNQLDYCF